MNKIHIGLICLIFTSLVYSREKLNVNDFEEIKPQNSDGLLIEGQAIGLVTTFMYPSRVASLSYLFNSGISIKVDPVIGIGSIRGYGANLGLHFGSSNEYDDGIRYGARFGVVKVRAIDWDESKEALDLVQAGYVAEYYVDVLGYYKISESWRWHWGVSLGRGIISYEDRSDIGKTIEKGGTLRAELGVGWLMFK